jgi:hypothetical protein
MSKKTTALWTMIVAGVAVMFSCNNKKVAYTIPRVKGEIAKARKSALHYKRQGELEKASKVILKTGKKILQTYPKATLTYETVKRFLRTAIRIGNLCLDRGQELQQEAVSNRMWKLAEVFKKRHKKHQGLNRKLRKLLPSLPKAEVSAKTDPRAIPGLAPRPGAGTTGDATPSGGDTGTPQPTTPRQGDATPPADVAPKDPSPRDAARPARPSGGDLPPPEKPLD